MNTLFLGRRLGDVTGTTFKRHHLSQQIHSLEQFTNLDFSYKKQSSDEDDSAETSKIIAHQAGSNCLAVDNVTSKWLVSGGADTTVRLWNLESRPSDLNPDQPFEYTPAASISRSNQDAHSHAITSISLYPFDPTPQTLLTTSYDRSLLLSTITPTTITPLHKFLLDFTAYTHAISSSPESSSSPLVAVGTSHPAVRLLDLRSGLSTHSLPGHNSAIYTLTWHPRNPHILISGSADSRILCFDIRRASSAFASLDLDDAIGVVGDVYSTSTGFGARSPHLDFKACAHNGAVTGVLFSPAGDKLISAGHDQRIRVWDTATGRNELVHFGPRIRNERQGELKPLISPPGASRCGKEVLLWANDDGKGDIFMHSMREGNLLSILRTQGLPRNVPSGRQPRDGDGSGRRGGRMSNAVSAAQRVSKLTSGGRINGMAWRVNADCGEGVELYTAHGDGRICAWLPSSASVTAGTITDMDDDDKVKAAEDELDEAEARSRKRKRDLIGDLVEGLTKKPVTFS